MIKGLPGTSRNTANKVVEKYFNELAISCPYLTKKCDTKNELLENPNL